MVRVLVPFLLKENIHDLGLADLGGLTGAYCAPADRRQVTTGDGFPDTTICTQFNIHEDLGLGLPRLGYQS
jgi:hypothetical protein